MNKNNTNRRIWLQTTAGAVIPSLFLSCTMLDKMMEGKSEFNTNINKKAHWARRENWTGKEYVHGVAGLGDRYLMVKMRNAGWDFPGGPVVAEVHGQKTKDNKDLIFAAAGYVNSQALISQRLGESNLFAYGFAINPITNENSLIHWFNIGVPNTFASEPHPNLKDSIDAKWVTLDDPVIGRCLRMRIQEYQDAAEGGSILKQSCFDYSV